LRMICEIRDTCITAIHEFEMKNYLTYIVLVDLLALIVIILTMGQSAKQSNSLVLADYPLMASLAKIEETLGTEPEWVAINQEQENFLHRYGYARSDLSRLPEIKGMASHDADDINDFLKEQDLRTRLDPLTEKEFALATAMDLDMDWLCKGQISTITTISGKKYPGVQMYSQRGGVEFYKVAGHSNPIAILATASESDTVQITMLGRRPESREDLLREAMDIFQSPRQIIKGIESIHFPMVDLRKEIRNLWMVGLFSVTDDGVQDITSQAVQEIQLKMDERGFIVKTAFVRVTTASVARLSDHVHVIDKPFLIWFERKGVSQPLLVAYVSQEDWSMPKR
jgi:hypothetical protein